MLTEEKKLIDTIDELTQGLEDLRVTLQELSEDLDDLNRIINEEMKSEDEE